MTAAPTFAATLDEDALRAVWEHTDSNRMIAFAVEHDGRCGVYDAVQGRFTMRHTDNGLVEAGSDPRDWPTLHNMEARFVAQIYDAFGTHDAVICRVALNDGFEAAAEANIREFRHQTIRKTREALTAYGLFIYDDDSVGLQLATMQMLLDIERAETTEKVDG